MFYFILFLYILFLMEHVTFRTFFLRVCVPSAIFLTPVMDLPRRFNRVVSASTGPGMAILGTLKAAVDEYPLVMTNIAIKNGHL